MLSNVIKKFEEHAGYTSRITQGNSEFMEYSIGRNIRLLSNLISLRRIMPLSNIYKLGFDTILTTCLRMIETLSDNKTKTVFLAKVCHFIKSSSSV